MDGDDCFIPMKKENEEQKAYMTELEIDLARDKIAEVHQLSAVKIEKVYP